MYFPLSYIHVSKCCKTIRKWKMEYFRELQNRNAKGQRSVCVRGDRKHRRKKGTSFGIMKRNEA